MQKSVVDRRFPTLADPLIFCLIGLVIYFTTVFGERWLTPFHASTSIDLALSSLPLYAMFSMLRGLIAYLVSLAFTLVVGYWAAHSKTAEKILIPFLDIMQSIPVLGFLPGLVIGLVALFPHNNVGLELAAIFMIFTGQVWNMTFAYYSSLKSIPTDLNEAAAVIGFKNVRRLQVLELPYAASNLTWNSIMSMAGGWFFLTVCEAFVLGDQKYQLPGLGAYMQVAIDNGNQEAIFGGIVAMALVIIALDVFLWKPVIAWTYRFRLEDSSQVERPDEPLFELILRESFFVRWIRNRFRSRRLKALLTMHVARLREDSWLQRQWKKVSRAPEELVRWPQWARLSPLLKKALFLATLGLLLYGLGGLGLALKKLTVSDWSAILLNTFWTFLRVLGALLLSTVWTVPFGIWVSQSPRRLKILQPVIQLMASFPAPMLYPLVVGLLIAMHVNFQIIAMALMLLGVQWYVLFNVLAGGLRIPVELSLASRLMGISRFHYWRYLLLPSVFPSLVTGWVTAAGGAWNASIVAEIMSYKGQKLQASGLGAMISQAAESGDFAHLAACLVVMVIVVVMLNRIVWTKLYHLAQTRFRLDL